MTERTEGRRRRGGDEPREERPTIVPVDYGDIPTWEEAISYLHLPGVRPGAAIGRGVAIAVVDAAAAVRVDERVTAETKRGGTESRLFFCYEDRGSDRAKTRGSRQAVA